MLFSLQMIIVLKQHIWFPFVFCAEETNCYLKVCFPESREDKTLCPAVGWPDSNSSVYSSRIYLMRYRTCRRKREDRRSEGE
jgi:hypothetical protein